MQSENSLQQIQCGVARQAGHEAARPNVADLVAAQTAGGKASSLEMQCTFCDGKQSDDVEQNTTQHSTAHTHTHTTSK